jgi:hypothetical protein
MGQALRGIAQRSCKTPTTAVELGKSYQPVSEFSIAAQADIADVHSIGGCDSQMNSDRIDAVVHYLSLNNQPKA